MKEKAALRWRAVGLLLAVLVIVALPYMVTRMGSADALSARDLVTHSADIRALTYQVGYLERDREVAIYQMFAGSADAVVRRRALTAPGETPALLAKMREMTRDNPDQQTLIGSLETSLNGRSALIAQGLRRYQEGNVAAAAEALRDSSELFKIDPLLREIAQNEAKLLVTRRSSAFSQAINSQLVLAIGAAAQILLLAIIVVVSERQISRRLAAEDHTRGAVRRSQMILQTVREPIALLDAKLNTLLVNAAFREIYGLAEGREHGLALAQIGDGAWQDGALLQRLTDVLARDRELWDYEMTQRTVDGVDRFVVINARRLQQPDDNDVALLLTVSDITARALVEQQITELNHQLEGKIAQISDVNRELEAFSYSVSHDLRAPLRHIAGFAGKLEQHLGQGIDERAQHYIEVIVTSARRMAVLIDDLLVFSRLGRGPLRLQAVDMQSLVEEAKVLAENDVPERQIDWHIAPLPIVIGDENMLRTVWQNLIGNAVKYTGKRARARIEVNVRRSGNGRGDYEFSVKDNGAGFDMQYAAKLFGVFQRLHRASEFAGNGIGLANVRRIVARHGGRVWAEGELEQGATFHFSLPAGELGPVSARASK
jgi:PAS domain S-box-containing protein